MDATTINTLSLLLTAAAAIFTYYKFFREGSHKQRIEFSIDVKDLGVFEHDRVIEVIISAVNRGHVEQKFDDIRLPVRGIRTGQNLSEFKGYEPRLAFPEKITSVSVIPDKYQYFFVRPGVVQNFPVVVRIPSSWRLVQARATFKYFTLNELHSAEGTFSVGRAEPARPKANDSNGFE